MQGNLLYRVGQLLMHLGYVDLDISCSTILLGQQVANVAAHQPGEFPNICQPNLGARVAAQPCSIVTIYLVYSNTVGCLK